MIDALGTVAAFALGLLVAHLIWNASEHIHHQRKDRP